MPNMMSIKVLMTRNPLLSIAAGLKQISKGIPKQL